MDIDNVETVLGQHWPSLWPAEAQKTAAAALEEARAGRAARFTDFCPTAKGAPKWWDVVVTPMTNEAGEVTRLLSISRDITDTREAADKLRWTSEHDGLTTLPNREAFQAHLQAATLRAMESGGSVGLLLMDLDHFKHVNDTLGHAAGDHLLKTFGHRLKSSVRGTDLIARLGGDEFAVILEGVKGPDDLIKAGEGILNRLHAPIRYGERVLSAGASIGGALFPADAASAHELFKNADTALYALKNAGRGGTRMFHNYMREEAQKVASQLSLARGAISEESVVPHYQPKIELSSGRVCGFEALLRWHHPSRGIQMPDTVAEAFKDYELASKIGELMQTKVFSDIRNWQRAGIGFGRVSINAAPAEFLRDDYAERLLGRLAQYQVPGELIEVEVTEHVFLERGSEYVSRALKLLNESGIRISLDDFGTGYSSLSHLRDFPVDVVKIDRSFISKMVEEPEIRAIVSAVIDLAASLSIEVVAEGIETEEQRAMLRSQSCALGQGYLFGRAVIADEVRILLSR
jgi:diguanylate cyclase (GGDEF)-like protein